MLRLIAVIAGALVLNAQPALGAAKCTRENAPAPKPGTALNPRIELALDPDKAVVNFAGGRGIKRVDFTASRKGGGALPDSLTPDQIELRVVHSFSRVGDKIETTTLPEAVTFTEPDISGDEINFSACFDLKDAKPGSYVGQVRVGGPRGLERAAAPVTINAQNDTGFLIGLVVALLLALAVMLLRMRTSDQTWTKFAATASVSLAAAGYAMYSIYSADPAWGADFASFLTIVGAGLAAAGLKSTVDAITPGSNG